MQTVPPQAMASQLQATPANNQPLASSTANEDLLKSIGFLPTETLSPPEHIPSYPTDFDMVPANGEPSKIPASDPRSAEGSGVPAFVMVENPCSEVMSLSSNDSLHQTAPQPLNSDGRHTHTYMYTLRVYRIALNFRGA